MTDLTQLQALHDKIEGLESELFEAVLVAYQRGAVEWTRLNYPKWFERLKVGGGQPSPPPAPGGWRAPKDERDWILSEDAVNQASVGTGIRPGAIRSAVRAYFDAAFPDPPSSKERGE